MPIIHITEADTSPVRMMVNNRHAVIMVGVDTELDEFFIPSLENCDPIIKWRYVGDPPADAPLVVRDAEARREDEEADDDDFNPLDVIDGNADEVVRRLADLTPRQLERVREAENDTERPRVTVMTAIDRRIADNN